MFPPLDYVFDFFTGTTSDLNMSRMVAFFEENRHLHNQHHANPWTQTTPSIDFREWYGSQNLTEENFAHPTMMAYKCAHTD